MPILDLKSTRVLVTGGAGFIGSHLVERLLAESARVRVLDNFATGKRENLAPFGSEIELLEGDLRDPAACAAACRDAELVFHQAALGSVPRSVEDPATTMAVNAQGTANLLAAARDHRVRRIVYASSSSVYGDSPILPKREGSTGAPLSPYALSKQMDEQLATVFHRCYAIESVGLRYFNIYGPRQDPDGPYAAVIPKLFLAFLTDTRPTIHGDGEQTRDFTFVADAVTANLLAAGGGPGTAGKVYNVAAGRRTSVNDLARIIADLSGSNLEPLHGPPRPGDVRDSLAALDLVETELGYRPSWALEDGLAASLDHYRGLASQEAGTVEPGGEP